MSRFYLSIFHCEENQLFTQTQWRLLVITTMPSLKRNAVEIAALSRKLEIMSQFEEACKAIYLHRKWIPDVVFSGVMNNCFDSNVQYIELNKALNTCRGLELDNPSNPNGKFWATLQMHDPTSTTHSVNSRIVPCYYICNHTEKPHIMFGHW